MLPTLFPALLPTGPPATPQPPPPPPPSGQEYVLAAAAQGLVLTYYGLGETFQSWLPDWYLTEDETIATTAYPDGPGPLVRFLTLIGYEMDWIRSEIESFSTLSTVEYISGAMLPYLGGNYGVAYEPELGMTRTRVLVKNAVQLYKTKGIAGSDQNPGGISGAASAFSGYGAVVTLGSNFEIQLDDSAFDRSVGHWRPANGETDISIVAASSVIGAGPYGFLPIHTLYSPVPPQYLDFNPVPFQSTNPAGYLPVGNENVLQVTALGAVMDIVTSIGLPCVPEQATPQAVTLSAYVVPANPYTSTLRSFYCQIDWKDINGVLISSSVGAPVMEIIPPIPQTPIGQWVRMYVSDYAPPGAYTFDRRIKSVEVLGGDDHLIDAELVEFGYTSATPGPGPWEPPRDIKINLLPVRQNLIPNPVGLGGTYGWAATIGTLAPSFAAVGWPAGTSSGFSLIADGSGAYTLLSGNIPVNQGFIYSLSLYLASEATSYDALLSTTYYDVLLNSYSGPFTSITTTPSVFVRGSIIGFVVPLGMVSMSFSLSTTTAGADETNYVGAPLFAPEASLLPYFDANFLPITDYLWESTVNQSVSDYYPMLPTKLSRLVTVMADYVPIGSTYSLIVAPEALANAGEVD